MNKRWLALLKQDLLWCHCCGLLITSKKHLTADHWPVPRSAGGKEVRPAHYWCDQSHENRSRIRASDLARLIDAWKRHGKKVPVQAYESLKAMKARE